MNVIAFEAANEKGMIKIPEQYVKSVGDHVQVILVLGQEVKKTKKAKIEFKALSLDTKNIKFTRDEANGAAKDMHIL